MSPIEVAFAIGLAVASSFWGYYLHRALEKRQLPRISDARRKSITGNWAGVYYQDANEKRDAQEIRVSLELTAGSRLVTGMMRISDAADFQFHVEGAFYHDRYLRLNYTASGATEHAIDFGAIFLVLGDLPDKMSGKVAGYGSISESLISGVVDLKKA